MPFIVFNAVTGIVFFLALNFIMKFYSMCLERKTDRAHVIMWSLCAFLNPGLKGYRIAALWVPWEGAKCSVPWQRRSCLGEHCMLGRSSALALGSACSVEGVMASV